MSTSGEKWREAGWESPDHILDALTNMQTKLTATWAVLDRASALSAAGPDQFKAGQSHLAPAFREVNWRAAFMALAQFLTDIEQATGYDADQRPEES